MTTTTVTLIPCATCTPIAGAPNSHYPGTVCPNAPTETNTALHAPPLPVEPLTAEDLTTRLQERMEQMVADGWEQVAAMKAHGTAYSLNNLLLIVSQCPDASIVMPASMWKQLGRWPRKGSRALRILAPVTRVIDETTGDGKPAVGEDGKRSKRSIVIGFRTVPVFDISQTDGEPLPFTTDASGGDLETAGVELDAIAERFGVTVETVDDSALGSARGQWSPKDGTIRVAASLSPSEKVLTIAHELGHVADYRARGLTNPAAVMMDYQAHRADSEAVAETVATAAAARYGINNPDRSADYVLGWSRGDPKRVGEVVDRVAGALGQIGFTEPSWAADARQRAAEDAKSRPRRKKPSRKAKKR